MLVVTPEGREYYNSIADELSSRDSKGLLAKGKVTESTSRLIAEASLLGTLGRKPASRETFFSDLRDVNESWSFKWPKRWSKVERKVDSTINKLLQKGYLKEVDTVDFFVFDSRNN